MSNFLAIATVTATLQRLLQGAVQRDVDGARVTTVRPNMIGNGTPESGVNLFLYHCDRNVALRNGEGLAFRSKAQATTRQSSLDLYYMLSFYGNDTELEPQRLLGSVVRSLSDKASLTPDMLSDTVSDSTFTFLETSDLVHQEQQLTISPVDLDVEELSKIWSVFFQAPYLLSMAYKVMVVQIDGEDPTQRALPVRESRFGGVAPFAQQPIVEHVEAQAGRRYPIFADSVLVIRGQHLRGHDTQVRVGNADISPQVRPLSVTESQLTLSLAELPAELLRAGVQLLQVIHHRQSQSDDDSEADPLNQLVESNGLPFILRPQIQSIAVQDLEGDDTRSAQVLIKADVLVGVKQRVVLSLNEWSVDAPATYSFEAKARDIDTQALIFSIRDVKPGNYLVRLQIDGAESPLEVDTDPNSPTFNWFDRPKVVLE